MKNTYTLKYVFYATLSFAVLLFTSCGPTSASIKLRPDLTTDSIEIWEVYGEGWSMPIYYESYADFDYPKLSIKEKAAEKSKAEGYDCFVLFKDYYSYKQGYSDGWVIPTATWYVFFEEYDECRKLKNSKWRENLYYNKNYLKGK